MEYDDNNEPLSVKQQMLKQQKCQLLVLDEIDGVGKSATSDGISLLILLFPAVHSVCFASGAPQYTYCARTAQHMGPITRWKQSDPIHREADRERSERKGLLQMEHSGADHLHLQ